MDNNQEKPMPVPQPESDKYWNGLKKGDKQNTTKTGIQVRLKRMKDFYNNKNTISNEHGIKYIDV